MSCKEPLRAFNEFLLFILIEFEKKSVLQTSSWEEDKEISLIK